MKRPMTEALKVTKVTGKGVNKVYWYNGAEPKRTPPTPPVNRGGYRMDPQKGRLYSAEREAFLGPFDGQRNREIVVDLPELTDVRRYVNKVCQDRWFRKLYPHAYLITVSDGRGESKAVARGGGMHISVARRGRARWVVLHEIAHCLQASGTQHHGPEFVKIYLALVRHFLGRAAWKTLWTACRAQRVKMQVRKRARRPISPEARTQLVARLAHARAAAADRKAREKAYELEEA